MKELNKSDLEIQSVDIKEYLFKLVRYWKIFVVMAVLSLIIAKFINIRTQRVYNLNSLITITDEQNPLFSVNLCKHPQPHLFRHHLSHPI